MTTSTEFPGPLETLTYANRDGVAWVTLNRPEVYNAFNNKMLYELRHIWRGLRRDDSVRAVVLTGAGDRAFCSGVDRKENAGERVKPEQIGEDRPNTFGSTPFMFNDPKDWMSPKTVGLWKPIIAAVNGMACGGAFYLLGEADIIIAADHATFFDPHVTYGLTMAYESAMLASKMPLHELLRIALLGNWERMSAQRAKEVGFLSEVVPLPQLHERAEWIARAIASAPPNAIQATLRAVWAAAELSRSQSLDLAWSFVGLGNTADQMSQGDALFKSGVKIAPRIR